MSFQKDFLPLRVRQPQRKQDIESTGQQESQSKVNFHLFKNLYALINNLFPTLEISMEQFYSGAC